MIKTFLQAEWKNLVMANYTIDSAVLKPYLPFKTELDFWNGKCYVSLVGFMFLETKVKGLKIPFHTNFEEVNLRFYVRYKDNNQWKRGVVFIKEIVPKFAITFIANTIYGENYETLSMKHHWINNKNTQSIEYKWQKKSKWNSLKIEAGTELKKIEDGSEEEFITEHYWGYTKLSHHKTSEYGVEHPKWQVFETFNYEVDVNFGENYGPEFQFLNSQKPASVFLAEGSQIEVKKGKII